MRFSLGWLMRLTCLLILLTLSACGKPSFPAPIIEAWQHPSSAASRYRVQPGDTVYSIAFAFGFDHRDIERMNGLKPPYAIKPGRLLVLRKAAVNARKKHRVRTTNPTKKTRDKKKNHRKYRPKVTAKAPSLHNPTRWAWPVKGPILQAFKGRYGFSQGIDIGGHKGQPVRATAGGVVVYSGHGVHGYGNLVILKHSEEYLSAYAYLSQRLVRVGNRVKAGQQIAKMGTDSAGSKRLHFEVRREGIPVNPMRYLR